MALGLLRFFLEAAQRAELHTTTSYSETLTFTITITSITHYISGSGRSCVDMATRRDVFDCLEFY